MAITSRFYTGYVNNIAWAAGTRMLGFRYAVAGAADWRVEVNLANTRGFTVKAGVAYGGGIEDTNTADITNGVLPFNAAARWHLIGIDRVWGATNASVVQQINTNGSTKQLPTRPTTPGTEDVHPLALAYVPAGGSQITELVDLRLLVDNSGVLVAYDSTAVALIQSFLNGVGTRFVAGDVEWTRILPATWVSRNLTTPPACRLTRTAGVTIANTTTVAIEFNTEFFDAVVPMHDNSTNRDRITFAQGGLYAFGGNIQYEAAGTAYNSVTMDVERNGSEIILNHRVPGVASGSVNQILSASGFYRFDAGDYIKLRTTQSSGASRAIELAGGYSPVFWATRLGD